MSRLGAPSTQVDETLAQMASVTAFSKLDANCGFWQILLDEQSRSLTNFITPLGCYCFSKLPFGILSAPEHFQRRQNEILAEQEGGLCPMDDILIFGHDQEHDSCLRASLEKIQEADTTQKCANLANNG